MVPGSGSRRDTGVAVVYIPPGHIGARVCLCRLFKFDMSIFFLKLVWLVGWSSLCLTAPPSSAGSLQSKSVACSPSSFLSAPAARLR